MTAEEQAAHHPGDTGRRTRSPVGALLADRGAVVPCDGGDNVMAAAVEGVASRGGLMIGIRPSGSKEDAHPSLPVIVTTNMGEAPAVPRPRRRRVR